MMALWASLNQQSGIIFLITVEWNSRIEQRWLYIAYLESNAQATLRFLLPRCRGHQSGGSHARHSDRLVARGRVLVGEAR